MIEQLGFDVFARDRATQTIRAVGKASAQAAVDIEAANLRVEKAKKRLADAEAKHGKGSLQARDAANKLAQAQVKLQTEQDKTTRSTERSARGISRFGAVSAVAATVAGAALFRIGKAAVTTASDINESQSKVGVVFGQSSKAVLDFAETTAESLGVSKAAALEAAGTFGNLFVSLKLPQAEAAKMSVRMVKLAADMASFNNTTPEEALEALRAGLVGETEPLRRFGVNIQDATLRQKALEMGLISTTKDTLPPAIKAQASYALILDQTKTAQGDFARTSDGLANAQRRAQARMSDLSAELGGKLLPIVRGGTIGLLDLADAAERNASTVVPAAAAMGTLATSIFLANRASAGLSVARERLGSFSAELSKAGSAGARFRLGVGALSSAVGGPLNIALAAGAVGVGLMVKKQVEARGRVQELTRALDQQSGMVTKLARELIFKNLQDEGAIKSARDLGLSLRDVTDAAAGNEGALRRVNSALDQTMAGLDVTRARGAAFGGQAGETKERVEDVRRALGDQNSELAKSRQNLTDAAAAAAGTASAAGDLADSSGEAAGAMKDERSEAEKLKDSLDKLTGKTISADEAAIDFEQSIDDLTQSIKDNGRTLNINTEAGRKNRSAVIDAARAAMDHIVALRDQGASYDTVTKVGQRHREQLIKVANEIFHNRAAAARLVDQYLAIPKSVKTDVRLDTRAASRAAREIQARINGIHGKSVRIGAQAVFYDGDRARRINSDGTLGPIMRARGGPIDGPGTETSDSIPARLSKGEHVWTAKEVRAAGGHGAMQTMRRAVMGGGRGYAEGGAVGLGRVVDVTLDRFTERLSERLVKHMGAALGMGVVRGWLQQWAAVHRAFPGAQLFSAFRPGAITSSGNRSYHSMGRAIDITPSMAIFDWIARSFGRNAKELIYSPAGGRQIKNGRPHFYGGQVRADHWDHVHWAMDRGGVASGMGMFAKLTPAPERVLSPAQTRSFDRLVRVLDRGGGRGGDTFIVQISGVVSGSEQATVELVSRSVKAARRSGHLHKADFQ